MINMVDFFYAGDDMRRVYDVLGEYYASSPSLIIHLLSCMYTRSHIILTL
jgi:hypothetical protein